MATGQGSWREHRPWLDSNSYFPLSAAAYDYLWVALTAIQTSWSRSARNGAHLDVVFVAAIGTGRSVGCRLAGGTSEVRQVVIVSERGGIAEIRQEAAVRCGNAPGD